MADYSPDAQKRIKAAGYRELAETVKTARDKKPLDMDQWSRMTYAIGLLTATAGEIEDKLLDSTEPPPF